MKDELPPPYRENEFIPLNQELHESRECDNNVNIQKNIIIAYALI